MHLSRINPAIEGTLYLKRMYQRNLFVALLIGISLHLAALGTYYVFTYTNVQDVTGLPPDIIEVRVFERQPPRITDRAAQDVLEQVQGMIPKFGIPVAVPADEIIEVRAIPTRIQRIPLDPSGPGTGQQYAVVPIEVEPRDIFPAIDTFIVYDENPEAIHLEPAVYPTMARRAGIGGYVRVRVLLDKAGYVLNAVVEQVSTENVGFEEAAVSSALKGRWTPAMQNNQPVPCWVSYTVTFDIE